MKGVRAEIARQHLRKELLDHHAPISQISLTPTIHKIPLIPPLPKGEIVIPLFGKEGRGEIF